MFSEVPFGIPQNTEFCTELTLFRVIPSNSMKSLLYNTAEFHIGSCIWNSVYHQMKIQVKKKTKKSTKGMVYAAEFRKGSCIRNSIYLQMSSVLNHLKN